MTTCTNCSDTHKTLEPFVHGETEKEYMVPCPDCPRCAHCRRFISENVTVPLQDGDELWCESDCVKAWLATRTHIEITPIDALYLALRVKDRYLAAPDVDHKWKHDNVTGLDDLVLWVLDAITIEERAQKSIERGRKG